MLIDTEEGVLKSTLSGPLGELFDSRHLVSDQYGAGNNWAQGHMEYGPKCREEVLESVRRTVETCESIQSFFLLHSIGPPPSPFPSAPSASLPLTRPRAPRRGQIGPILLPGHPGGG